MKQEDVRSTLVGQLHNLLHWWFIRYNPLYFFSALCLLVGAFLVSPGLEGEAWQEWETVLTAVIECYEILLIAGAALLFRYAEQFRPSAILGVLAVFFLFDPTFQTEVVATFDHMGFIIAGAWILLVVLKLLALRWAFRLTCSFSVLLVPVLAAIGIAGIPHVLSRPDVAKDIVHLLATWYGIGLAAFIFWKRPIIRCTLTFDEWGQRVFQRITNAVWMIWAGFYLYHLIAWVHLFDIVLTTPTLYIVPGFLLLSFFSTKESRIWAGGVGTLAVTLLQPSLVAPIAFVVSLIFGWQAWRLQRPRLYVGAVLACSIAVWTLGWQRWPLPELDLWLTLVTAVILLVIAWRFRLSTALLPLLLGLVPVVKLVASFSTRSWGMLLIAVAFMTLIVGVAINWGQRHIQVEKRKAESRK